MREKVSLRLSGSGLDTVGPAEIRSAGAVARGLRAQVARATGGNAVLELELTGDARPGRYELVLLGGRQPLVVPIELSVAAKRAGSRTQPTAPPDASGKRPGTQPTLPGTPSAYTPGAALVIRVEDDDTDAPIAGAYVCLGEPGGNPIKYGRYQTNAQGETPPWTTVPQDTPLLATVEAEGYEGDADEVDLDPDDGELLDVDTVDLDPGSGGPTCQPPQFAIPQPLEGEVEQGPPLEVPEETYDATPPDEPGADPGETKPAVGEDTVWEVAVPGDPVAQGPDLVLTLTQSPGNPVSPGQNVQYTVEIQNLGNEHADPVAFESQLPPALEYESRSNLPGFACEVQGGASKVRCTGGELQAGLGKSLVIVMSVPNPPADGQATFAAIADPDGALGESNESNNDASVETVLALDTPVPTQDYGPVFSEDVVPLAEANGFSFDAVPATDCGWEKEYMLTGPKTGWMGLLYPLEGGCTECTFQAFRGKELNPGWRIADVEIDSSGELESHSVLMQPVRGASFDVAIEGCAGPKLPGQIRVEPKAYFRITFEGPVGAQWYNAIQTPPAP